MTVIQLIHRLKQSNAKIAVDQASGTLKISAPEGALTPDLLAALKAHKQEIIALLSDASAARVADYEPIPRLPEQPDYALSCSQERLWVMSQIGDGSLAYNMTQAFVLDGALDKPALLRAFETVIERHEILRTVFVTVDGESRQKVLRSADIGFRLDEQDLRGVSAPAAEAEIDALVEREARRPFDLERGPLLRALVVRVADERHVFVFSMHHIISDGWSVAVFVRELLGAYAAYRQGRQVDMPPLSVHYKDYAAWHTRQLAGAAAEQAREFWKQHLGGELPTLELPTDRPRPQVKTHRGALMLFTVDEQTSARLTALARKEGGSLYMLVLAAVNVLLYRYSGQREMVLGTPVSGRIHPDLEEQIGFYVNTLALRSRLDPSESFSSLLRREKDLVLAAMQHQAYPFDRLIDDLQPRRDLSRSALFDVMVVYQWDDFSSRSLPPIDGLGVSDRAISFRPSKFDLTFTFKDVGGQLGGDIEYNTDLFDAARIERMVSHLRRLLDAIAEQPELPIGQLEILPEAERRAVLFDFNATDAGYPEAETLVSLFEAQVARTPERVALSIAGRLMTYRELNAAANRVAHVLRRDHGVRGDDLIALLLDRSEWMIVAILGALKAGAAYVPIDPEYPRERIRYMLEDSGAKALLTSEAWLDACAGAPCPMRGIESVLADGLANESNPERINQPADLAYVIYTSGTTGNPKGVLIEHRHVVRLMMNDRNAFDFGEQDVWTLFHSYCFDFSTWEIYGALLFGGRLVIVPRETARNADAFCRLLGEQRVTVLNQTPSAFKELLSVALSPSNDAAYRDAMASLRYVIFGGEALSPGTLAGFHERYPSCSLINMYGITETTVHVTYKKITGQEIAADRSNIGLPIPTLTTYLLDENQKPVPVGVPGEIYVGGLGVARGYLNRPELTRERFLDSPFRPGERLYRSGDLAVRLPDGELEYLGRADQQVKVRGYRIELGEIESALLRHPEVKNAAVIALRDADGDTSLVAYVVCEREPAPVAELREFLRGVLPEYMVPAYIMSLDKLPLTSNGKIDRKALPRPDIRREVAYTAPRTEEERLLVALWEDLLGRRPIGVHDNFFDLGGHSLKATRLVTRVHRELGVKLDLQHVFTNPTIEALARQLEALLWVKSSQSSLLDGTDTDTDTDTITI